MNPLSRKTEPVTLVASMRRAVAVAAVALFTFALPVYAQPGPGGPKRPGSAEGKSGDGGKPGSPRGFGQGERGNPFSSLTQEEQKRVREVLAEVWQDPAVMAAKEGVRVSTDEYREALKNLRNAGPVLQLHFCHGR